MQTNDCRNDVCRRNDFKNDVPIRDDFRNDVCRRSDCKMMYVDQMIRNDAGI